MTSEFPMKTSIFVIFLHIISKNSLTHGFELKNITDVIFGPKNHHFFPLAFGDFNSDKLTDIIICDKERSKISILLAKPQTFALHVNTSPYFDRIKLRDRKLECAFNSGTLLNAVPGDFDGDGGMDILLTFKIEKALVSVVYWGSHIGNSYLICTEEAILSGVYHPLNVSSQPLSVDFNGDNAADIFVTNQLNIPGFYHFSFQDRSKSPYWTPLQETPLSFRIPHSNAILDLNHDGNADLFLTTSEGFQIWTNDPFAPPSYFVKSAELSLTKYAKRIGQSSFADFNLDGVIDMIFPVCFDVNCDNATILFSSEAKIDSQDDFVAFVETFGNSLTLDMIDDHNNNNFPYYELTPRIGDINLDGYPDILIRLKDKNTGKKQTHLLLNDKGIKLMVREEFMSGMDDTVMATFFDLYENGQEDLLVFHHLENGQSSIGAYSNLTVNSEAYFVKVIVLTGACVTNCAKGGISVPYGTNFPGRTVCYKTQRQEEISHTNYIYREIRVCAPLCSQTAHSSLQLPYTIFGLGLTPNFLDFLFVNITNSTSGSKSHSWPQIIPNSQLYVIPYPFEFPSKWYLKLFITPSASITLTGLALISTCFLVTLTILFLHWRERRQDIQERLQESHRFHFDAM